MSILAELCASGSPFALITDRSGNSTVLQKMNAPDYIDEYSACSETFSALRVYHDSISPSEVTARLGIRPTRQAVKGERRGKSGKLFANNGWFLESSKSVDSRDSRRHIDWIVDQLWDRKKEIQKMLQEGFKIDISSFWVSASGNGGPIISPYQMARLADLQIEAWWDIYFPSDDGIRIEDAEHVVGGNGG